MGLLSDIKKEAQGKGINIASIYEQQIERICNNMFYTDKNVEDETKFVEMVMTRGAETQERVGLHASAITKGSDAEFCYREHVLSLLYKQNQSDNVPVKLKRIFEEGNAIHEKWQRLFIRNGYAEWYDCDNTQYHHEYMISFTPDIICYMPIVYDRGEMLVEVKSMNDWAYSKQATHAEGQKQLMWYLHLAGKQKGFVLADNKNTQEFRIEAVDYDEERVKPYIERAENIMYEYHNHLGGSPLPPQRDDMDVKKCKQCSMHDACKNVGMGRIPINKKGKIYD